MLLNAATSQVKCANNPLVSSSNITKQLTYLEPSQTSAMGLFCKNSSQRKAVNYFRKKVYFRWTIRFWIRFWPGSIFFVSFYCLKNVFKASESVLRNIFQVRFLSSRNSSWGSGKKRVGYRFRFLFFFFFGCVFAQFSFKGFNWKSGDCRDLLLSLDNYLATRKKGFYVD